MYAVNEMYEVDEINEMIEMHEMNDISFDVQKQKKELRHETTASQM